MPRASKAVLVIALLTSTVNSAATQPAFQGLQQCGTRAPVRYAVVFDASSSVRKDSATYARTEANYASLLRALSSVLCPPDLLTVYAFPADSTEFMSPVLSISSDTRSATVLHRTAQHVISRHTGHTDLQLTLRGIQRDILKRHLADAVFLITDGSFYPANPDALDRSVSGLLTRLNELAEYVANTIRLDSVQLHVIGVNAQNVYAIDRDLKLTFPASPEQRQWSWAGHALDLKDDKGDDLLRAVFGTRFVPADSLSLWNILFADPDGLWNSRLGYITGWRFPLAEYRTFSIEHILFIPDAKTSRPVACPTEGVADPGKQLAAVRDGLGEVVFCSLARPTDAELDRLQRSVHHFAFLQQQSLRPVQTMADLAGLHQLTLHDGQRECKPDLVPAYFNRGEVWPPLSPPIGTLRLSPIDSILWGEAIPLVRLPGSDCLIPSFAGAGWAIPKGNYLAQVEHDKTSVYPVSFRQPSDSVIVAFIRPGGLPFPSDQIALVRVCVRRTAELKRSDRLWMILDGKQLALTPERGRERCGRGGGGPIAGFSGLVIIRSPEIYTARILLGTENSLPSTALNGLWTPVTLRADGRLFLSWLGLTYVFIGGFLVQLIYLCYLKDGRLRLDRLWWGSAWTGAMISGIVCAVAAEFVVLVRETNVATDHVPVIFALSVMAHMAKLVAAALVSEHVEEFILNG